MGRTVPRWSPPPQKKKRPIEISETTTALYHGSAAAGRHLFRASHLTPLSGFFLFCFWRFFISLFISSLLGHFRRSAGPPDGIISLLTIHRCVVLLLRFVFELLRRQRRTAVFRVFHRSVFTIFYSELFGTERLQKGRSPVPSRENRRRVLFSFFLFFCATNFRVCKAAFQGAAEGRRGVDAAHLFLLFTPFLHVAALDAVASQRCHTTKTMAVALGSDDSRRPWVFL